MPPRIQNRDPSRRRSFWATDKMWTNAQERAAERGVAVSEALNTSLEAFNRVSDVTWARLNEIAEERGLRLSEVMNLSFEAFAAQAHQPTTDEADA